MKVLTAETDLTSATNISKSPVVRIYNSDSSAITLTRKSNVGETIGSYSVPSGKVIYCQKTYTDTLEGSAALKATGVGYSEELEIICLGSDSIDYVTSSLQMHLDADSYSGSGDWLDATSNDNDGTINGATYVAASGSDPAYFDFDGSNDLVYLNTIDSTNIFSNTNWSINYWFNTQNFPSSTSWTQSQNHIVAGPYALLFLHGSGGPAKQVNVHMRTTSLWWHTPLSSGTNLSEDTWYNICVTYDPSSGYILYQNSVSVDTYANTQNLNTTSETEPRIGATNPSGTNRAYDGKISIMSIYEKTLDSDEVIQNYNAFKSRYGY